MALQPKGPEESRSYQEGKESRGGGAAGRRRADGSRRSPASAPRQRGAASPEGAPWEREQAELLAEIAHQLLTPVTSIKAAAEVLLDETAQETLDRAQKDILLKSVVRGAGVLESLIQQLLEYGQLRTGHARLAPEVVDAGKLAQNCVVVLQPTLLTRRQSVRVDVEHPLPLLALDAERIEQALLNLLSNASKFSPPGAEIVLAVGVRDDCLVFTVRDACGGMSEEELAGLFQPYVRRRRAAPWGRVGGSGLGLAIAKGWVEMHGGSITVENTPGSGCAFVVSVPTRGRDGGGGFQNAEAGLKQPPAA